MPARCCSLSDRYGAVRSTSVARATTEAPSPPRGEGVAGEASEEVQVSLEALLDALRLARGEELHEGVLRRVDGVLVAAVERELRAVRLV